MNKQRVNLSLSSSIAPELKVFLEGNVEVCQVTKYYMPKVASTGLTRSTPIKIPEHPQDPKVAMIFEMQSNHSDEACSLLNSLIGSTLTEHLLSIGRCAS